MLRNVGIFEQGSNQETREIYKWEQIANSSNSHAAHKVRK